MAIGQDTLLEYQINIDLEEVAANPFNVETGMEDMLRKAHGSIHALENGHLDAAESSAVDSAITSATALQKIGAGIGIGLMLSATAGIFAQAAQQMQRLPGPFRNTSRPFDVAAKRFRQASHAVAEALARDIPKTMRHHLTIHNWTVEQIRRQIAANHGGNGTTPAHSSSVVPASSAEARKLQGELNILASRVNALAYALGIEQHSGSVPRQVWDSIHTLQRDVAQLKQAVSDLSAHGNNNASNVVSLQHQIQSLERQISGVSTVTTTWSDVVMALNRHVSTLTEQYNTTHTEQHRQASQLAQLAALGILLQPGVNGLRTLRQLEDTPCMCPKPDLSGIQRANALAYYLFETHG